MRRKLSNFLLTAASAGMLAAAPTYTADGVNALPDSGLGDKVFAYAGSKWTVDFEDLWDQGDADFNDLGVTISCGEINAHNVNCEAAYRGSWSADRNFLTLPGNVTFGFPSYWAQFTAKANKEIEIKFTDTTSGLSWFVGPAGYNDDRKAHAIVHRLDAGVAEAPEPSAWLLFLVGLVIISAFKIVEKERQQKH